VRELPGEGCLVVSCLDAQANPLELRGTMSAEPPQKPPEEPPQEPPPGPSPAFRMVWQASGILLASVVALVVVAGVLGGGGGGFGVGDPPSTSASQVGVLPPLPTASPIPTFVAPPSRCRISGDSFWMQSASTFYGPFGGRHYMAWDARGFSVWDQLHEDLVTQGIGTGNRWGRLTGTPFNQCVDQREGLVFGEYAPR
jgi:hypothetical protein